MNEKGKESKLRAEVERQHKLLQEIHELCHDGILEKQDRDSMSDALKKMGLEPAKPETLSPQTNVVSEQSSKTE